MDFILDPHCHSIASGHAYSTIEENIRAAKEKGLKMISITDHAPNMPGTSKESHFMNLAAIPSIIDGVELRLGVELNIMEDGSLDFDNEFLRTTPRIEIVIASLHPMCYYPKAEEFCTEVILKTMDNPCVQIIGHPGDPRFPLDFEKVVKKSLESGTLLEINEASLSPITFRKGSRSLMAELIKVCKKYSCPIVLGSDAHFSLSVGIFSNALVLIDESDFPYELIANHSIDYFNSLLKKFR